VTAPPGTWIKKGLVFRTEPSADGQRPWMVSHACVPTALDLGDGRIRIYFGPRNAAGQSIPTFIDVDADDPARVLAVHDRPILELGALGTFDDGGINPCSAIRVGGLVYLYYVGWNPSVSVPYRNSIGVAVSEDGANFRRPFPGAVVDRNQHEPYFTASPCVLKEGEVWRMWYASSTGFVRTDAGKVEPIYVIKYAHSRNGLDWVRDNLTCIQPLTPFEANARPAVLKEGDRYRMWFCYRGSFDYRDGADSYTIGYAESRDAVHWDRQDHRAGITRATDPQAWDGKMLAYPCVLRTTRRTYLFYNGNGFGRTGIGYAELAE
jgi:predicted GH43/DUF377 family glycosyl hydrolase